MSKQCTFRRISQLNILETTCTVNYESPLDKHIFFPKNTQTSQIYFDTHKLTNEFL